VSTRLPLLIFDGDCAFCTSSVEFLRRWVDRTGRYGIEPWQRVDLSAYGLAEADCIEAAQFVDVDGAVHPGHRAIAAALRQGAPGWRPVGRLLTLPGIDTVARRVYGWVARHRDQLPGGTPACALPDQPLTVPLE
jgi:predicted DCC family thiol-disulfide oxidoreductase YuxK